MRVHIHTHTHTNTHTHTHTHTYIYIYIYIYIYTHIYSKRLRPIPPGLGRDWGLGVQAPGSQQEPWGPYFGGFWGGLGSILEDFASFWKVRETQRLLWRSQSQREGVRKGQGRPRVGSGLAGESILVPTWAQHGPNLGPKIDTKNDQKIIKKTIIF